MKVGRRAFLSTLGAAAVGAMAVDPTSGLWVPAPKSIEQVTIDALDTIDRDLQASLIVEQTAELHALALRVAREMSDRLANHPSVLLREVLYRQTGTVGIERLLDATGTFTPAPHRLVHFAEAGDVHIAQAAGELVSKVGQPYHIQRERGRRRGFTQELHPSGVDMFAPIGYELRPGDAFSDDVQVAVAADPETGLSVRAFRFQHEGRRRSHARIGFEVAGGSWQRTQSAAVTASMTLLHLLAQEA